LELDLYKPGSTGPLPINEYKKLQQVARANLEQARKLAVEFGFTPYSMGKIIVNPKEEFPSRNELNEDFT